MSEAALIKLIEQGQNFNQKMFKHLHEKIDAQSTRTRGEMRDLHDELKDEINEIKQKQDKSNGQVKKNSDAITHINDVDLPEIRNSVVKSNKVVNFMKKNPGKCMIIIFVVLAIMMSITDAIMNNLSIKEIIELIKKLI